MFLDVLDSGGCPTSPFGGERVLPEQENQATAGSHRGEGHSCRRNQGHEGHVRGQRKEDKCPAEKGQNLWEYTQKTMF